MRWWKDRIVEPLRAQLVQGASPSRLAAALALGTVLGVFPVLGTTTLLSALAAWGLRLNQPAIQVANQLASPLQLALLIPFFRAGAALLGAPAPGFTLPQLRAELAADLGGTMARYLGANLRAVGAWSLVAPVLFAILYAALGALLARLPLPASKETAA